MLAAEIVGIFLLSNAVTATVCFVKGYQRALIASFSMFKYWLDPEEYKRVIVSESLRIELAQHIKKS